MNLPLTIHFSACCLALLGAAANAQNAGEILNRTRATYGAMRSYADTGVVVYEYGTASQDRHAFTTSFNRAPRHFLLDFRKQGGDRYVIWGDPEAFHTWWKTTGAQYDYPNPNNAGAISGSGRNTFGAGMKIPTLLYSKTPLGGDFNNFADVALEGTEEIGGHRCYRLSGKASDVYAASGREVNVRRFTVWIDAESFLIRKSREEPKVTLPGQRSRVTTTFEPQANPALDDRRFQFVASSAR